MSDKALPDPAALLRDMLGQWEKLTNSVANQAMQSSEFGQAMGQMSKITLGAQTAIADINTKVLSGLNLPSRQDLMGVSTQIQTLDDRLSRIESLLQQLAGASNAPREVPPRPPRTRKPAPK